MPQAIEEGAMARVDNESARLLARNDGGRTSMEDHWDSTLIELREKISTESFLTWLEPIRFDGFDGKRVRIRIPNRFYADWIRTHYLDLILDTLRTRSSTSDLEVDWKVDETLDTGERTPLSSSVPSPISPPPLPRPSAPPSVTNLNPKYRFETFVVGPSNQLAHAAAIAAASSPGTRYNPL